MVSAQEKEGCTWDPRGDLRFQLRHSPGQRCDLSSGFTGTAEGKGRRGTGNHVSKAHEGRYRLHMAQRKGAVRFPCGL